MDAIDWSPELRHYGQGKTVAIVRGLSAESYSNSRIEGVAGIAARSVYRWPGEDRAGLLPGQLVDQIPFGCRNGDEARPDISPHVGVLATNALDALAMSRRELGVCPELELNLFVFDVRANRHL